MDRCLAFFGKIDTVCDVPCGPGRLFPYWQSKKFRILGVELSPDMADSASAHIKQHNLDGRVETADAFDLDKFPDKVDLVASVRFLYYFDNEQRLDLLRSLRDFSKAYLLLQYKTTETWKGRRNAGRPSADTGSPFEKRFLSNDFIKQELQQAGLKILTIEPISRFSDRLFVAAQKV